MNPFRLPEDISVEELEARARGLRVDPVALGAPQLADAMLSRTEIGEADECWIWQGSFLHNGYGQLRVAGVTRYAHRVSFALAIGAIPPGALICHRCDRPECVRPDHLFSGTPVANMEDARAKGRLRGGRQILTDGEVRAIRRVVGAQVAGGMPRLTSQRFMAATFGISLSHVGALVDGRRRRLAA